jgi:hypothetical protein
MIAIIMHPEWWDWAMLLIVPLLVLVLVGAVWAIVSGLSTIVSAGDSADPGERRVSDIMGFLKQRKKPRRFPYDTTRHRLLHRE